MRKCYQSHLYLSLLNGCDGGPSSLISPTGGQNYLHFQRKTQEDWPGR